MKDFAEYTMHATNLLRWIHLVFQIRKSLSTRKERKEKYFEGWSSNGMKYWKTQWDRKGLTYSS